MPLKAKLAGTIDKLDELFLGQLRRKYQPMPFAKMQASVRTGTDLAPQEKVYRSYRDRITREALGKFLKMNVSEKDGIVIGVASSGGGNRARLATYGTLERAEKNGLLDALTYITSLSGSIWMVGPWIQSGLPLEQFGSILLNQISLDPFKVNISLPSFVEHLSMRLAYKQPLTPVNFYAAILGNITLAGIPGGPYNAYLHDQANRIKEGKMVFPIYTAIATKLPYQWVEFTPYEVGGDYFGYIPAWAFGSPFINGKIKYVAPPYSMAFILAITGAAFSARISEAAKVISKKVKVGPVQKILSGDIESLPFGKHRIFPAEVFNWTYGMTGTPRAQQEVIRLIDAGIAYGFGLEPLLRRKANVIFLLDNSESTQYGTELQRAEKELRQRGFALPPIDYTAIDKKTVSVFKDPANRNAPLLIYLPLIPNKAFGDFDARKCFPSWCGSFNFVYTREDAEKIINLAKKNFETALPLIKKELREFIENRRKA